MGKPESVIKVCSNVRLNSKYEHSIYFPNPTAQINYFAGKVVKTFSAYSYVRRFWNLKVEATVGEAKAWNYLYFKNTDSEGYQFYFINRINYINDATIELELEQDVIQTNLFRSIVDEADGKTKLEHCFIERQHVTDDAVGANTIDEGLDVGEYVNNNRYDMDELKPLSIMALSSVVLDDSNYNKTNCYATVRNGVFNGMGVYTAPLNSYVGVGQYLAKMDEEGYSDALCAIWMYPTALIESTSSDSASLGFDTVSNANPTVSYTVNRPTTLNGYTPRNNKLRCYPYSFIYGTNNNGSSGVFRWELFSDNSKATFNAKGSFTPDGGVRLNPQNYRGVGDNADEGLVLTGFPSCAWNSDEYKIWLAQNRNQHAQQTENIIINTSLGGVAGAASLIGGIATGNPMLAVGGGLGLAGSLSSGHQQMSDLMAQKRDRAIQPPQSKGSFSSNINIVNGCHTFSFYDRCIQKEYAQQIDDYFTMYGYKINRVQTPNIHARTNFTYIKTVGCKIIGLNNEDSTKIESVFNNGITFWTSGDGIGSYQYSNNTL